MATKKTTKEVKAPKPKKISADFANGVEAPVYNQKGKEVGKVSLPEGVFGARFNKDLIHQVVTSMLSSRRGNIAHTKNRGEISGGGKKPWKQKGTGRARHGSIRSPLWRGGGTTFGPRNEKNYDRKVNSKAKKQALFGVLSKKNFDGEIIFIDSLSFSSPKTKEAKDILTALSKVKGFERIGNGRNKALVAISEKNSAVEKSFRNFGNISVVETRSLNPVDLLNARFLAIVDPEKSIATIAK